MSQIGGPQICNSTLIVEGLTQRDARAGLPNASHRWINEKSIPNPELTFCQESKSLMWMLSMLSDQSSMLGLT